MPSLTGSGFAVAASYALPTCLSHLKEAYTAAFDESSTFDSAQQFSDARNFFVGVLCATSV